MLQALAKLLLLLGWQVAKRRIVLQRPLLFRRRQIFVLAQPVPGVAPRQLLAMRTPCRLVRGRVLRGARSRVVSRSRMIVLRGAAS